MSWTAKVNLPLYAGLNGISLEIYQPGTAAILNSGGDALADTGDNSLFLGNIDEELVGYFTYYIRYVSAVVQIGWLRRLPSQTEVILDDPRDFLTSVLTGPHTLSIYVYDDETNLPVELAYVRVYRAGEYETRQTDDQGNTGNIALSAATWSIAITANGYFSYSTSHVVADDAELSFSLTPLPSSVVPINQLCAVSFAVVDQFGRPFSGVTVHVTFLKFVTGAVRTGVVMPKPKPRATNNDGIVLFELLQLARYRATYRLPRCDDKIVEFTTPASSTYLVVDSA